MFALRAALPLCFALGLATPAFAGDAETKLATELTRMTVSPENYDKMLQEMVNSMLPMMPPGDPSIGPKLVKVMKDVIPYEEMVVWNAEIYASRFTAGELTELIKFYKTPLGKKLAKALPEITGEAGRKAAQVMPQRLPAAMQKHGLGGQ